MKETIDSSSAEHYSSANSIIQMNRSIQDLNVISRVGLDESFEVFIMFLQVRSQQISLRTTCCDFEVRIAVLIHNLRLGIDREKFGASSKHLVVSWRESGRGMSRIEGILRA